TGPVRSSQCPLREPSLPSHPVLRGATVPRVRCPWPVFSRVRLPATGPLRRCASHGPVGTRPATRRGRSRADSSRCRTPAVSRYCSLCEFLPRPVFVGACFGGEPENSFRNDVAQDLRCSALDAESLGSQVSVSRSQCVGCVVVG